MKKKVDAFLAEYQGSHMNPVNKLIHWICVPLIVVAVFGALRTIPVGDGFLNPAISVGALALAYYAWLSPRLALAMVPVFALVMLVVEASFAALGTVGHLALMGAIFVGAWIGQFYGHYLEGAKPSFFKDLQFLLIGPLWLLAHLFRRAGIAYA
ncbi:MAG TPA: Mpo1-like protein [Nevskiaceae bacterium]|nr:Mpo1-like protein [Nevskiaceae bacterium]